jgi:two-component sensor histidine kinase
MEARLIRAEKLAAIGQAAASIAHEVRNALAGISGTVQVLKGSAAWKELPDGFSEEFDLQVTRIAHIVNDLMSYARPGTLHTARTNVHTILSRILATASPVAEAEGKRIETRFSPEDLHAEVDAGRLEQAFTNLVTNALQAMEKGGRLRVTTDRREDRVRIRFQDTGCGMAEETLSRAFEPFFTTKVRGTGLGLPIVRTILEAHNGTVDLASEPGSGTTVTLSLPAEPQRSIQENVEMNRKSTGVKVAVAALVAVLGMAGGLLLADGFQYVGAAKCKACHMPEHKTWTESAHAKAFDKLKPEEQTKAECLSCHSTGHGKTAAEGADLKGVQCEACHGPGSEYKSMKIMNKKAYADDPAGARKASLAAGMTLPDEATCKGCHNEKSPTFKGFDYASAKEKIKHWD